MSEPASIQKIRSSHVKNISAEEYAGYQGLIWFDAFTGELRIWDNNSPGGRLIYGNLANINTNKLVNGAYQFVLDASGNITAPGAISALGNISASYFIGNGSQLSSITGANVVGQVGNALVATLAVVAGTVSANAQPNITSVGTLTSVSVSGNAVTGNITTPGQMSALGNIAGNYFIGNGSQLTGLPAGYSNAQVATYLASGTDTSNIITTANITGNYFIGNGSQLTGINATTNKIFNGNSYANVAVPNGNVVINANGKSWTFDTDGALNLAYVGLIRRQDSVNIVSNGFAQLQWVDSGNINTPDPNGTAGPTNWAYVDPYGFHVESNINYQAGNAAHSWSFDINGNLTSAGDLQLVTNNNLWKFDASGNLTLPGNTSSINYANGSPYGGAGNIAAGNVRIQDENVTLTNAVNTINFAGNGVVATNVGNLVTVTISGAPTNIPVQTGNAGLVLMTDGGNLYWNGALGASYEIDGAYANSIPPGAILDAGGANADYTGETQIYGGVASSDYSLTLSGVALTGQYEDLVDAPAETAVPLTTTSLGVRGQMAFNANWLYVCISDNQWRRALLNSW